jgi:fucose 4-O-acetylase-like acetyltransferase
MMQKKEAELENCSFIKTVLMLCIVLYHSLLFWSGTWFKVISPERIVPAFSYLTTWLNSFHIYGFVLVSGYLFYYVKYERGGVFIV